MEPSQLRASMRCPNCGTALNFGGNGRSLWLVIGGRQGEPRLAVPVPREQKLEVGCKPACFLTLPGDEISEVHAELKLDSNARLTIRHIGDETATWINRSKILEGVLRAEDALFIGPYRLAIRSQADLVSRAAADVIVEDEDGEPAEPAGDDGEDEIPIPLTEGVKSRQGRIRLGISIAAIVGALGYLGFWLLGPSFSKDMPNQTVYRCPVDGTIIRAEWVNGPPKCPHCGALCLGNLKYKEDTGDNPASQPAKPPKLPPKPPASPPKSGGKP